LEDTEWSLIENEEKINKNSFIETNNDYGTPTHAGKYIIFFNP
jgi:hypothetical protein